jgi:hypothetical protein
MKAVLISNKRIYLSDTAFASISVWRVPQPVGGSAHEFKYRLAYVVDGTCVLRYDNETGKGDHRHYGSAEEPYAFTTLAGLLADFQADIARWDNENNPL